MLHAGSARAPLMKHPGSACAAPMQHPGSACALPMQHPGSACALPMQHPGSAYAPCMKHPRSAYAPPMQRTLDRLVRLQNRTPDRRASPPMRHAPSIQTASTAAALAPCPPRSSRAAYHVTPSATTATTAATHGSESSGCPWVNTTPPSHAPPALPKLNAPIFNVDARFGACFAFSTTRVCSGGTVANAAMPQMKIVIAANVWLWLVFANTAMMIASATRMPISEGINARSANFPPIVLPIVKDRKS